MVASILNIGFVWGFFGEVAVGDAAGDHSASAICFFLAARRYGRAIPRSLGVALLVLLFFVVRRYPFIPDPPLLQSLPIVVGLSYLIFGHAAPDHRCRWMAVSSR